VGLVRSGFKVVQPRLRRRDREEPSRVGPKKGNLFFLAPKIYNFLRQNPKTEKNEKKILSVGSQVNLQSFKLSKEVISFIFNMRS
jgi:hypothetical protein